MSLKRVLALCVLPLLLLVGCSASRSPRLIGSYPAEPAINRPLPNEALNYQTFLEMEVSHLDAAASQAAAYASQYHGYLAGSQRWYDDGDLVISLDLRVPDDRYADLRRSILRLGRLIAERQLGQMVGGYPFNPNQLYSKITLELHQHSIALPVFQPPDSRFVHTLREALGVLGSILSFLLEVSIWLVVVLGPFVLAGWLVWRLIRSRRG